MRPAAEHSSRKIEMPSRLRGTQPLLFACVSLDPSLFPPLVQRSNISRSESASFRITISTSSVYKRSWRYTSGSTIVSLLGRRVLRRGGRIVSKAAEYNCSVAAAAFSRYREGHGTAVRVRVIEVLVRESHGSVTEVASSSRIAQYSTIRAAGLCPVRPL